ncbi:signal recognition particle GTPase [Encephalitozoon intestinalis ATCC 50506]|uniref:Signal recognition particle receptor subunit alpha homolog n=1 Tax=Encephalitozoon intestinalis (strain ATCC 50506) TaxID=876142 RepID=E0S9F4_ENCIT|nr:signal recognition particle GTPase [Encephalitozoon intestinalis ATCC 50506]ADM12339.1 signal recognition particle GTPase [Encephalitozoon intestinalis ATCC 50506]UTX46169.1 signal recognition particle receptor subunit alpha [Encephalitozoon intestinalis]
MGYFCVFNKRGLVIHEEGRMPEHFNQIVVSLDVSRPGGERKIRDEVMEYEIRGAIVYLSLSRTPNLKIAIDNYLNKSKEKAGSENKKRAWKKNKERKWEDIGNEEELNYSSPSSGVSNFVKVIKKATIQKAFGLFKDQIQVKELKDKMTTHLINKNVSYQITRTLVENVMEELSGEGLDVVSEKKFKEKMSNVLGKLIPSVDHEKMLDGIRKHKGVFSICFVGVNGVGKSTSLAKICYWLLKNKLKVYIAACDTFRAGAIEQLKTHVERFQLGGYSVGFYQKGYGKDDASVARCAIQEAQHEGYDVILIDTAGRMHNKKNLMMSLTKLMKINKPDHIIYVGEALVGSDSLEHIKEFNRAIKDADQLRNIDSILLTKVDTVDNKIGQILNMAFSSNAPILFLGVGQTNSDLSNIGSEDIVNSLMSS